MNAAINMRIAIAIIITLLLFIFATGHWTGRIQREREKHFSVWKKLPVGVYIKNRDLFKPAWDAMKTLNKGFNRNVFKPAGKGSAQIRVVCTNKLRLPYADARTYLTTDYGYIEDVRIYVICEEHTTDETGKRDANHLKPLLMHELYHALGFVTPGLGHSYQRDCISHPFVHEGQIVCREMKEDFNKRYSR